DMVFLKFNNSTFSATTYPKLALIYPGLKLTEHRGEFIRIWDDGRGVDSGRALLSAQDASAINLLLGENANQPGLGQISVSNDDG
ncbi:phage tail protein, partial [Citrobacter sp. Igbk 17]|nr:phage tail protein [Citrobacter sp. Igbk 17]